MSISSNRIVPCKTCGEEICFFRREDRSWVAVDAAALERGDAEYDPRRHHRHRCPEKPRYETARRAVGR